MVAFFFIQLGKERRNEIHFLLVFGKKWFLLVRKKEVASRLKKGFSLEMKKKKMDLNLDIFRIC
jgi:hypothetical protein